MTTLPVNLYMCMFHYTMVWSCLPLVQKGIFSIQPVFYVPYWISLFSLPFLTCFSPLTFGMKKRNELVLPPLIIHFAIQQDTTRIEKHQSYFLFSQSILFYLTLNGLFARKSWQVGTKLNSLTVLFLEPLNVLEW